MDDSFQKIVAASHPFFSRVLIRYGSFTPEDAGRRKDIGLSWHGAVRLAYIGYAYGAVRQASDLYLITWHQDSTKQNEIDHVCSNTIALQFNLTSFYLDFCKNIITTFCLSV